MVITIQSDDGKVTLYKSTWTGWEVFITFILVHLGNPTVLKKNRASALLQDNCGVMELLTLLGVDISTKIKELDRKDQQEYEIVILSNPHIRPLFDCTGNDIWTSDVCRGIYQCISEISIDRSVLNQDDKYYLSRLELFVAGLQYCIDHNQSAHIY